MVIAEDEALIRLDLAEMLGEEGYDVVAQAGDGQRAVELVEEHRPDLVVLDVKMPKLDGISAAERIAEQRIAPVVILTAFSQRDLVERARDIGAMAYLVKPFQKHDLAPTIEMATARFAEVVALETEVSGLTRAFELWAAEKGIRAQRTVACNSLMGIVGLTIADVGISFLPARYVQPWLNRGALVALRSVPPLPTLGYCFIRRKDDTRAVVSTMRGFIGQIAGSSDWADPAVPVVG